MEEKGIWNKVKGMIPSDILFVLPNKDGENHIYSINRKKFMVLTGVTLFCAVLLVGLAGFYGWQYHHMAADRVAIRNIWRIKQNRTPSFNPCWMIMKRCCVI